MMFNNVLNGKKGFLDYKNVNLTVKMSIVLKGVTHDFSQKFENLLSLIFFGKDLDIMFKYVLNKKKKF